MKEPFADSKVAPNGLVVSTPEENPDAERVHQTGNLPKGHLLRMIVMILTATGLACLWVLLFALPAQG
ncbi:MAG: hypothetical protein AAFW84_33515 [Cyanobacteria bacterium J06635_15]